MRLLPTTLRGRLLALGTIGLLVILGLAALEISLDRRDSREAVREDVEGVAGALSHRLAQMLEDGRRIVEQLADHPAARDLDTGTCPLWWGEVHGLLEGFADLLVVDALGSTVCGARDGPDGAGAQTEEVWFRELRERREFVVAPPQRHRAAGVWVTVLGAPILDEDGELVGAVAAPLHLSRIQRSVDGIAAVAHAVIVVADSSGRAVARVPDPERWVGVDLRDGAMRWLTGGIDTLTRAPGTDGVMRLWAYADVPGAPWRVSAGFPEAGAMAALRRRATRDIAIFSVVLLLIGSSIWAADGMVRRGVHPLQVGAEEAAGRRGIRIPVEGLEEFASVSRSLNRTLEARDRAEAELVAALERHELVLRATRDMIWDWDIATGEVHRNEALRNFAGEARSRISVGHRAGETEDSADTRQALWLHRIPEPDRTRVRRSLEKALDEGDAVWVQEYPLLRPDGSRARVLDRGYVVRDDEGTAVRVVGVMSDVTNERRRAAELRRAKERYESILRHAPFAVLLTSMDGAVLEWNAALESMLDESWAARGPARPRADSVFVDPEEFARLARDARMAGTVMGREALWKRADGTEIYVRLTASSFLERGRTALEILAEDVTERRRLGEQVRHAQKMEAVGRLAGGVAHDFNNLLTVISGEARFLLREELDDELTESLEAILEAGDRGSALTRQLLAFSRRQVVQPVPLDLDAVVAGLDRMLGRLLGETVQLELAAAGDLPAVVVDPGEMEQIVVNLVVNARDAMPHGGTVTLTTGVVDVPAGDQGRYPGLQPGPYVFLEVRDAGVGMDPGVVSRVFEPFFTTKPVGKGTGLGLSTVYGIVTRAGGHVEVESVEGEGTLVTVLLPASDVPLAPGNRPVAPVDELRGDGTVAVVEDEPGVRRMAERILDSAGYTVLPFGTPKLAIAGLADLEVHVDILVTDIKMPGMDGERLAERIRKSRPDLPVLFVSGYPEEAAIEDRVREGRTAFLAKPFSPNQLLHAIRMLLDADTPAGRAG